MAKMFICQNCGEGVILGESLFGHQAFKIFCPSCKKRAWFSTNDPKKKEADDV